MTAAPSYKAYHRAAHTVAKTKQVVMLYDGAIRFLQQAKEAMEQKAIETRYNKLTRASEIIMGLQSCLDFDVGGEAAQILYSFYSSVDARLMSLHRSNDMALCDKLISELREMRDVWNKIDQGSNADTASAPVEESSAASASVAPVTVSA